MKYFSNFIFTTNIYKQRYFLFRYILTNYCLIILLDNYPAHLLREENSKYINAVQIRINSFTCISNKCKLTSYFALIILIIKTDIQTLLNPILVIPEIIAIRQFSYIVFAKYTSLHPK